MFGKYQQSHLRIELKATQSLIFEALTSREILKKWLPIQYLSSEIPTRLTPGISFTTGLGIASVVQKVEIVNDNSLRLLLAGAIDGYHEWYWGEGWIQSKLEGISLLPLNLSVTLSLLSLREYLQSVDQAQKQAV